MKKVLKMLVLVLIFYFVYSLNIKAEGTSEIKKVDGNKYEFKWSGLTFDSNNDYGIECSNSSIISGNTNVKNYPNGLVTLTADNNTDEIVCRIYKDDEGKPEITKAIIKIGGTTTTKAPDNEPSTTAPTTTVTTVPKSNNNNLKSLVVNTSEGEIVAINPKFNPNTLEYNASVLATVKVVNIDASTEDSKAKFEISKNASEELVAGDNNKITITVTAEDGTKKVYTVNVKREALTADATLKTLTIKEDKNFVLVDDVYEYTVNVKESVTSLTLDFILNDMNSTIEIEDNENLKNGSKVKLIVTAQDGTKKIYTLNVAKEKTVEKEIVKEIEAEKNPLVIMVLSIIAFGLIGGIIYVIKK